MPITTDSLGVWDEIGIIFPTEEWTLFQEEIIGANTNTIRLSYFCDWTKRSYYYGSCGLIRFYYPTATAITVSPSIKIWPQADNQIRELQLPAVFQTNAALVKSLGVKKINRRYGYEMPDLDPPWSVKIEVLLN